LGSIPDFWCPVAKLAIEIDATPSEWKRFRDNKRDARYAAEGIRTLHVPAKVIFQDPAGLTRKITAIVLQRTEVEMDLTSAGFRD